MYRTIFAASSLCLLASMASAQQFTDYARVRSVEPQYETIHVPRQECQWVGYQDNRYMDGSVNYGGVAIGAVAGGLIGNQVGNGRGREAVTAAGAVIGALTGDRLASSGARHGYGEQVRRCHQVVHAQTQIVGYRVSYEYRGIEQVAVMRDHPGATIPVHVSVIPAQPEHWGRR